MKEVDIICNLAKKKFKIEKLEQTDSNLDNVLAPIKSRLFEGNLLKKRDNLGEDWCEVICDYLIINKAITIKKKIFGPVIQISTNILPPGKERISFANEVVMCLKLYNEVLEEIKKIQPVWREDNNIFVKRYIAQIILIKDNYDQYNKVRNKVAFTICMASFIKKEIHAIKANLCSDEFKVSMKPLFDWFQEGIVNIEATKSAGVVNESRETQKVSTIEDIVNTVSKNINGGQHNQDILLTTSLKRAGLTNDIISNLTEERVAELIYEIIKCCGDDKNNGNQDKIGRNLSLRHQRKDQTSEYDRLENIIAKYFLNIEVNQFVLFLKQKSQKELAKNTEALLPAMLLLLNAKFKQEPVVNNIAENYEDNLYGYIYSDMIKFGLLKIDNKISIQNDKIANSEECYKKIVFAEALYGKIAIIIKNSHGEILTLLRNYLHENIFNCRNLQQYENINKDLFAKSFCSYLQNQNIEVLKIGLGVLGEPIANHFNKFASDTIYWTSAVQNKEVEIKIIRK